MESEQIDWVTRQIDYVDDCMRRLARSGFDAGAFEMAANVGVAVVFVFLFIVIGHCLVKWLKNHDTEFPLEKNTFKFLGILGTLLVALPVVTKVAYAQFNIVIESGDINYARGICERFSEQPSEEARLAALVSENESLKSQINQLTADLTPENRKNIEQSQPALVGVAVAVFTRDGRQRDAESIANMLSEAGAGASVTLTDLTENKVRHESGSNVIIFAEGMASISDKVASFLESRGTKISQNLGPLKLRGNSIQLLLY